MVLEDDGLKKLGVLLVTVVQLNNVQLKLIVGKVLVILKLIQFYLESVVDKPSLLL